MNKAGSIRWNEGPSWEMTGHENDARSGNWAEYFKLDGEAIGTIKEWKINSGDLQTLSPGK